MLGLWSDHDQTLSIGNMFAIKEEYHRCAVPPEPRGCNLHKCLPCNLLREISLPYGSCIITIFSKAVVSPSLRYSIFFSELWAQAKLIEVQATWCIWCVKCGEVKIYGLRETDKILPFLDSYRTDRVFLPECLMNLIVFFYDLVLTWRSFAGMTASIISLSFSYIFSLKTKHHKIDLLLIMLISACFINGWQVSFKDIGHDSSKNWFSILLCITINFDL